MVKLFEQGFLPAFTGVNFRPMPWMVYLGLAKKAGKEIEDAKEPYVPIKALDKDDYGDFADDYKDALEAAVEDMGMSEGSTADGGKVKIPTPPKTEEQKNKEAEQNLRATIKHDVPKTPPGPPLTADEKEAFKEVMEPIRILLQHV